MTKRHFEAIAAIVKSVARYHDADKVTAKAIAEDLAFYFAKENPRFDRGRFLTACGFGS